MDNFFTEYLRIDADLSLERTKRLRSLMNKIGENTKANGNPSHRESNQVRKLKKRKKTRDGNRIKRAATAYNLFVQDHFQDTKNSLPNSLAKDVIATLAQRWAESSEEEKMIYKDMVANATKSAVILKKDLHEYMTDVSEDSETQQEDMENQHRMALMTNGNEVPDASTKVPNDLLEKENTLYANDKENGEEKPDDEPIEW